MAASAMLLRLQDCRKVVPEESFGSGAVIPINSAGSRLLRGAQC